MLFPLNYGSLEPQTKRYVATRGGWTCGDTCLCQRYLFIQRYFLKSWNPRAPHLAVGGHAGHAGLCIYWWTCCGWTKTVGGHARLHMFMPTLYVQCYFLFIYILG